MAVNVFGLTAALLRADYLPQADDFSAVSSPTATSVARILDQKAAELQGRLLRQAISAAAITTATSSEYLWCQETLGLMVMIRVVGLMTGVNPELVVEWQARLDERLLRLADDGGIELGNAALAVSVSDPNGPTTHITELGLDVSGLATSASTITMPLRKDDRH